MARYTVRTVRPRLVRVPRAYSAWRPGGELPCASGTYRYVVRRRPVRVGSTYSAEARGARVSLGGGVRVDSHRREEGEVLDGGVVQQLRPLEGSGSGSGSG